MARRFQTPNEEEIQSFMRTAAASGELESVDPRSVKRASSNYPKTRARGIGKVAGQINANRAANKQREEANRQQAAQQREVAAQQRETERQGRAMAAEQERQRMVGVRAAAAEGIKTTTDIQTGRRDIQRHPDGAPVFEAGPQGQPFQQTEQRKTEIPTGFVSQATQTPGAAPRTAERDVTNWQQTVRDDRGNVSTVAPESKVDPKTGEKIHSSTDPVTGQPVKTVVGIDMAAQERAKRLEQHAQASQALAMRENAVLQSKPLFQAQWGPARDEYQKRQTEWNAVNKDRVQRDPMKGGGGMWTKVDAETGKKTAMTLEEVAFHSKRKKDIYQMYDAAKKAHDKLYPTAENFNRVQQEIAAEKLRLEAQRLKIEAGLPDNDGGVAESMAARITGATAPTAPTGEATSTIPPGFKRDAAAVVDPTATASPEAAPAPEAIKAFSSLPGATLEPAKTYTAIKRAGKWIGSIERDPDGTEYVTLRDEGRQDADANKIVRDAGTEGTPVFIADNPERPRMAQEEQWTAGVLGAKNNPQLVDPATGKPTPLFYDAMREQQAMPKDIAAKVQTGLLSVQRGEAIMREVWGDTLQAPDAADKVTFEKWIGERTAEEHKAAQERFGNPKARAERTFAERWNDTSNLEDRQRVWVEYLGDYLMRNQGKPGVDRAAIQAMMRQPVSATMGTKVASAARAGGRMIRDNVAASMFGLAAGFTKDIGAAEAAVFGSEAAKKELQEGLTMRNRDTANWFAALQRNAKSQFTDSWRAIDNAFIESTDRLQRVIDEEYSRPTPDKNRIAAAEEAVKSATLAFHDLNNDPAWPVTEAELSSDKDQALGAALARYAASGDPQQFELYRERLLMDNGRRQQSANLEKKMQGATGFQAAVAGAMYAGWQEVATELLADAAIIGTGGASKAAQMTLRGVGQAGKAQRLSALTTRMAAAIERAGTIPLKAESLVSPLTKAQRAMNTAKQVGGTVVKAAVGEGTEEVIAEAGADQPKFLEAFAMGALGGLVLAPVFHGGAAIVGESRDAATMRKEAAVNATFAARYNAAMIDQPDFEPINPVQAGIARQFVNEQEFTQAVATMQRSAKVLADPAASDTAKLIAQNLMDGVRPMLANQTDSAVQAAKEISQMTDPQQRIEASAYAKVATGNAVMLTPAERSAVQASVTEEGMPYFTAVAAPDGTVTEQLTDEGIAEITAKIPVLRPLMKTAGSETILTRLQDQAQAATQTPTNEQNTQGPAGTPPTEADSQANQAQGPPPVAGTGNEGAAVGMPGDNQAAQAYAPDPVMPGDELSAAQEVAQQVKAAVDARGIPGLEVVIDDTNALGYGGVSATPGRITIHTRDLAVEASGRTRQQVHDVIEATILRHEVMHLVDYEVVEAKRQQMAPDEEYNAFRKRYLAEMAAEIPDSLWELAANIYNNGQAKRVTVNGKTGTASNLWADLSEEQRARTSWGRIRSVENRMSELLRMMAEAASNPEQAEAFTELFREKTFKAPAGLLAYLKAMVQTMIAKVKELPAGSMARMHVDEMLTFYRGLLAAKPAQAASLPDNTATPPAEPAKDTPPSKPAVTDSFGGKLEYLPNGQARWTNKAGETIYEGEESAIEAKYYHPTTVMRRAYLAAQSKHPELKKGALAKEFDDIADAIADVIEQMPVEERTGFMERELEQWIADNLSNAQAEEAPAGDKVPNEPAKRRNRSISAQDREAAAIINSRQYKVIDAISEQGGLMPRPSIFALIRNKVRNGGKLTEKERKAADLAKAQYDDAFGQDAFDNSGRGKVARRILSRLMRPQGQGLFPDVVASAIDPAWTPSDLWAALYDELKAIAKGTQGFDPNAEMTDAEAEARLAEMDAEKAKDFDKANTKAAAQGAVDFPVEDFNPDWVGTKLYLEGEELEITEVEMDEAGEKAVAIVLQDGARFGRQEMEGGEVLFAETGVVDEFADNGDPLFSAPSSRQSPFYSQLSRVLEAKMPKAAPVGQVVQIARSNAKEDEVKWSGLVGAAERLAAENGGKVPKDKLLEWLAADGAVVLEEVSGSAEGTWTDDGRWINRDFDPKFGQYTLPGGQNYREVVLAMPTTLKEPVFERVYVKDDGDYRVEFSDGQYVDVKGWVARNEQQARTTAESTIQRKVSEVNYTSSHFPDVPNYVAHMRTNERTDAEGKPGLFIEEAQSDRHQSGRKDGYAGDSPSWFTLKHTDGRTKGRFKTKELAAANLSDGWTIEPIDNPNLVADAPFRRDWPIQLFKRALRDAVAAGKEWIGWTTGTTQGERFDLSKQVDAINVDKTSDGQFIVKMKPKGGREWQDVDMMNEAKLADTIGKDLAQRVIDSPERRVTFEGDGLKTESAGMKGFYDNMLPKEVQAYVKQWKAEDGSRPQVRRDTINGGIQKPYQVLRESDTDPFAPDEVVAEYDTQDEAIRDIQRRGPGHTMSYNASEAHRVRVDRTATPIWRLDITDAMRKGVMEGQPLFASKSSGNQGFFDFGTESSFGTKGGQTGFDFGQAKGQATPAGERKPVEKQAVAADKKEDIPAPEKTPPAETPQAQPESLIGDKPAQQTGITDFGEKIGGARKDTATKTGSTGQAKKTSDKPGWFNRYEVNEVIAEAKPQSPLESYMARSSGIPTGDVGRFVINDKRKVDWKGNPERATRETFATREEAEAYIPVIEVSRNHRVRYEKEGEKVSYVIWRDVTDRKRVQVVQQKFDTEREAMEYMVKNAADIIETKTSWREELIAKPEKSVRVGPERRTGPATPEMFQKAFGFRGVEFGNWMRQAGDGKERQEVLNHAYDGLLDLAELLGIPPKAISLNGELGLAFGARGQGLSGAKAHYESDYVVINLTKMSGAGSLAHEWIHALDHYLGRQDGMASSEWKTNATGDRVLPAASPENRMVSHGFSRKSNVREEVREAFNKLKDTIFNKAVEYVEDSDKAEAFVARSRKDLEEQIAKVRKEITAGPSEWAKRRKVADEAQLAVFDSIADRFIAGQELETTWRMIEGGKSRYGNHRHTNDALEQIGEIYKATVGRSGFQKESTGPLDYLRTSASHYRQRLKMLESAAASETKVRKVPTDYSMNAKRIDQGSASDYWNVPHEMLARAFSAYVEDRISQTGGTSDFLSYGSSNNLPSYRLFNVKPFPEGKEREMINEEFDKLFDTIESEETDKGVRLYASRSSRDTSPDLFTAAANAPENAAKLSTVKVGTMSALGAYRALTAKRAAGKKLTADEEEKLLQAERALGQKLAFDMEELKNQPAKPQAEFGTGSKAPKRAQNEVGGGDELFGGQPQTFKATQDGQGMLFAAASSQDPIYAAAAQQVMGSLDSNTRGIFEAAKAGKSPEEIMAQFKVSEKGITNAVAQVEARIASAMKAASPGGMVPQMKDGKIIGKPKLAYSANPLVATVDQERTKAGLPSSDGDAAYAAEGDARLVADYDGEYAKLQDMANRMEPMDKVEVYMAGQIIARETMNGIPSDPKARVAAALFINGYRELGKEWSAEGRMRRDRFMTPAQRNARMIAEALFTPDEATRDALNGADPSRASAILAPWLAKIDKIKAELAAKGIDIDAMLSEYAEHQAALEQAARENPEAMLAFKVALRKLSKLEKLVITLIRDGASKTQIKNQSGVTDEEGRQIITRFKAEVKSFLREAALKYTEKSLAAAPTKDVFDEVMESIGLYDWDQLDDTQPGWVHPSKQTIIEKKTRAKKKQATKPPLADPKISIDEWANRPPSTWRTLWETEMGKLQPQNRVTFEEWAAKKFPKTARARQAEMDLGITTPAGQQGGMSLDEWAIRQLQQWRTLYQGEMTGLRPNQRITFDAWAARPLSQHTAATQQSLGLDDPNKKPVSTTTGGFDINDQKKLKETGKAIAQQHGKGMDKVMEWWKASIMSGLQTPIVNMASTSAYAAYNLVPRRMMEAAVNNFLTLFGQGSKQAATFGEFVPMFKQMRSALRDAVHNAAQSWELRSRVFEKYADALAIQIEMDGSGADKMKEFIPGKLGTFIRSISFRHMTAADEFMKTYFGNLEAVAQAHRIAAVEEGLTGPAYEKRLAELSVRGKEAWKRAKKLSQVTTFQQPLSKKDPKFIANIDRVALWVKQGRSLPYIGRPITFALPFIDTPTNILKQAVEMSPLVGVLSVIDGLRALRIRYSGRKLSEAELAAAKLKASELYDRARFVQDLTNQITSLIVLYALQEMVKPDDDDEEGLPTITGTMPYKTTAKGERNNAYAVMPPMTIRIGKLQFSYARFDPFATVGASIVDWLHEVDRSGGITAETFSEWGMRFKDQVKEKTFLTGLSNIINALEDPKRWAERLSSSIITGFVPNLIRQPIRESQDTMRDTGPQAGDGFLTTLGKSVGYSLVPSAAPPKISIWGDRIPANRGEMIGNEATDWLFRVMDPTNATFGAKSSPVDLWIFHWNATTDDKAARIRIEPIDDKLQIKQPGKKAVTVPLTPEEHLEANRNVGQRAKEILGDDWDWRKQAPEQAERITNTFKELQTAERARIRAEKIAAGLPASEE